MKVAHGVAYGSLCGYAATLSEGSGFKQILFSTKVADRDALLNAVNEVNIQRIYRVQELNISPNSIQIVFLDNPGTMKKIQEFIGWFIPLLQQFGATGSSICAECGSEAVGGRWVMIDGIAHYFHDSCARKVRQEIELSEETARQEAVGSYGSGAAGALLGAVLGAVVWALVLLAGYVASIVGLLIGWLAEKGYNLLKGKQGKGKIVILIIAIIVGVLLGTFSAEVLSLIVAINDGLVEDLSVADAPLAIIALFAMDAEYRTSMILNIGMGLLFAGLGVYALLRKAGRDVADTKIVDLE